MLEGVLCILYAQLYCIVGRIVRRGVLLSDWSFCCAIGRFSPRQYF